jgi:hypothetical protein
VLEAILVYWISVAWVPKGKLERIKRIYFRFIWAVQKEHFVMPWIEWETLATPKLQGGWGLKNIHRFSKFLVDKVGWRLITIEIPWIKVVAQKHICPSSMEEWIRRPINECKISQLFGKPF